MATRLISSGKGVNLSLVKGPAQERGSQEINNNKKRPFLTGNSIILSIPML